MKKRILSLAAALLAVLMLLPALSACKPTEGNEGETTETAKVSYNLADYRVTRPESASADLVTAAINVRKALESILGTSVSIKDDWSRDGITDEINATKEILIGNTNRPESAAALENISDETCFVITVINNKIVVNGKNTPAVLSGVNYFINSILPGAAEGKLELPESFVYLSEPVPAIELLANGKCDYSVVYIDGLDNQKNASNEKDKYDLEVDLSRSIRTRLSSLSGIDESKIKITTDWTKPGTDTAEFKEILVGLTDRPETKEFLASTSFDEYGFAVIGNKIVVTGHNLTTTEKAVDMFLKYLSGAASGGKENCSITILADTRSTAKETGWFVDFPAYEGGEYAGAMDLGYENLQVYYSGTNETEYMAYRAKLEKEGYKLAQENRIGDNIYATYTGAKGQIHTYYIPYEKTTHIVTAPEGHYNLPANLTSASVPAYTKITETKITQMNLNYTAGNFGMCYIITLEDGSFVVIDGGGYQVDYGDETRLYNLLKELNVRPDGKIVIAAWMLTHEHWDHFTNFQYFMNRYGSQVELEYCFLNTPSKNEVYNSNNPNYYVETKLSTFKSAIGKPVVVKVHTGMKFFIRNAEFEILFTQEDLYPKRCDYFNESSVITRMTVAGQTVVWFGDSRNYGSAALVNRYGSYVKSDICQVAHHGYDGATKAVYKIIDPETLLWPTSIANQAAQTAGSTNSYYGVDLYIVKDLHVKSVIVAEPTQTITLPYKPGDAIVTNKN